MRDWFNQANLPHLSSHSMRKSTTASLAQAGASPHEIMSITDHQTLEEVERYTREAKEKEAGRQRDDENRSEQKTVPLVSHRQRTV